MSIEKALGKLRAAQMCHPNAVQALIDEAITAIQQAEAQQPAQAVNEKNFGDFELLVVTTAYEQGFGHAFRTELSNPYAPATNAYKAWDMGRSAGKRNGQPQQPATGDDFDLICNAIDKADTITMEGDYMLDSDDCIAVVRVMQVLLSVLAAK